VVSYGAVVAAAYQMKWPGIAEAGLLVAAVVCSWTVGSSIIRERRSCRRDRGGGSLYGLGVAVRLVDEEDDPEAA
jgi:hypothetical protein